MELLSIDTIAKVVVNVTRTSASSVVFDTGLILTSCTNFTEAKRLMTFASSTTALAALQNAGFTAQDDVYKATIRYFGASPSPAKLMVSCYPGSGNNSETPAEALEKVLEKTSMFYGVYAAGVTDAAALLELDEVIQGAEHPMVLFVPATGTVESATGENAIMAKLYDAGSDRSIVFYSANTSDAAALMGTAMGLQYTHRDSAFALCYRTITAVQPSNLTQDEVESIQDLNGNVYVTRGYTHHVFEKGTMASGIRFDDQLYLDLIADELQNEAVNMIAGSETKLPQTDDTTTQFMNRFSAILMRFAQRQILATGVWRGNAVGPLETGDILENGFAMWADSYDTQSDADRAARKAMPINVALNMAGAVESIVISVNVVI